MTKLRKLFTTMLLVLVTVCSALSGAVINITRSIFTMGSANADTSFENVNPSPTDVLAGKVVSIPGFEDEIEIGKSVDLPMGEITIDDTPIADMKDLFVEVLDTGLALTEYDETAGTVITTAGASVLEFVDIDADEVVDALRFTPSQAGTYQVNFYIKSNDVWTTAGTRDIKVSAEDYSMVFGADVATVMPEKFNYQTEQTINIALPLLYDEDGKLIENENILLGGQYGEGDGAYYYVLKYMDVVEDDSVTLAEVTKNVTSTTNVYTEYKTYTVKKVTEIPSDVKYCLRVSLTSSSINMNNYDSETRLQPQNVLTTNYSIYDLVPYKFDIYEGVEGGKYVVTYNLHKYQNESVSTTSFCTLDYTMTGSATYKQSDISLVASTESNVKRSDVSYREKHYLPAVNAVNKNDSNTAVNAFYYYVIQVEDGDDLKSTADYVTMGRDEKGFYFVPNATRGSTYELTYNVVDAFGNKTENTTTTNYYTVRIYDDNNPIVVYSKAFDHEIIEDFISDPNYMDGYVKDGDIEDISYVIPAKYYLSTDESTRTIRIPAMAYGDYSGIASASRYIKSSAFIKDESGTQSDDKVTLYISQNSDGLPNLTGSIYHGDYETTKELLRAMIIFKDFDGRYIDAEGYLVNEDREYVDEDGNVVDPEDRVFAFKDEDGNPLTGSALRNAMMSCEATVTLIKGIFGKGEYTLSMSASENGAGKSNSNIDTTITLYGEDEITPTTPTVDFNETTTVMVSAGQDVYVASPVEKDETDNHIHKLYFVDVEGEDALIPVKLDESGEYITFNMGLATDADSIYHALVVNNQTSFKVVAFAFSDFAKSEEELELTYGETIDVVLKNFDAEDPNFKYIGYGSYKVDAKFAGNDEIPTIVELPDYSAMSIPTQYEEIHIGGFTFKDDTSTARVYATVTDTLGQTYECQANGNMTIVKSGDDYVYTYPGISFLPNNADAGNYYTVTYTIKDSANNVVANSFVLVHAEDKQAPVISGLKNSSATLELGEAYNFSSVTAEDNSGNPVTFSAAVYKDEDLDHNISAEVFNPYDMTFSPKAEGSYKLIFTAKDENNNTSEEREFTVTVKDSLAPEITLIGLTSYEILIPEDDIDKSGSTPVFPEVDVPTVKAQDTWSKNKVNGLVLDTTSIKITLTAPSSDSNSVKEYSFDAQGNILNGVENTLGFAKDGNVFTFTPNARGEYTITYTATDAYGNSAEEQIVKVNVGDTEAPQIYLTSSFESILDAGFVIGEKDTLAINNNAIVQDGTVPVSSLEDIYVIDSSGFNSTTDSERHLETVVVKTTITDSNGSTVSPSTSEEDDLLHYTFTTSGTYTLTLTVSDKVGNKETFTKQFYVTTKESSRSDASTVIGIVLIVVSALILAGVIVYFVRGTKLLPKKKAKKQDKKED